MGSEGFGSAMGKAGRDATAAVDVVAALVDGFDPELMGPRDAMDLVEVFSRIEHLASAGVALAARRVAETDLWRRRGGHRSAAHWLAHVTGMGVGDAVKLLETAEAVEHAPDTREALRAGAVSIRQAKAIGRAETADPDAGKRLLAAAPTQSAKELEDESARVVRAASTESEAERVERVRRGRFFRTWNDADGGRARLVLSAAGGVHPVHGLGRLQEGHGVRAGPQGRTARARRRLRRRRAGRAGRPTRRAGHG